LPGHLCRTEALANEVKDLDFICWPSVNTTVALFHSIGIPWNLEVNQLGAVILQADAF
jgi:hypothetical protein